MRLVDFVYHPPLGLRVIKEKKKNTSLSWRPSSKEGRNHRSDRPLIKYINKFIKLKGRIAGRDLLVLASQELGGEEGEEVSRVVPRQLEEEYLPSKSGVKRSKSAVKKRDGKKNICRPKTGWVKGSYPGFMAWDFGFRVPGSRSRVSHFVFSVAAFGVAKNLPQTTYELNGFKNSTPPQNRQLIV